MIKSKIRTLVDIMNSPADDGGLFPVVARIGLYGIILSILEYESATVFDANEVFIVVAFTAIITVVETNWKKYNIGRIFYWHFIVLVMLVGFLSILLNQAIEFRSAWYRTNVLEKRINELIETAPKAVIVADGNGDIKYSNKYVEKLIGWKEEELRGQSLAILMRESRFPAHREGFRQAVSQLKGGSAEWINVGDKVFKIVAKDKSLVRVYIYIVGIRYSPDAENGKYPDGSDIEFYAIIEPVKRVLEVEND